jgi:phosphohistidine phosphatase SixA
MSKEELKTFIEKIPLGHVSKFLEAVSKSENKTEKALQQHLGLMPILSSLLHLLLIRNQLFVQF